MATPCIDDQLIPREEYETTGVLSAVCAQTGLKCLYVARIGRPDLLWSVNTLARSVTKWNKACGKRLLRLITCIIQTKDCRQFCRVEDKMEDCKLGLFQDASLAGDVRDSESTSGGVLCVFGTLTFGPISWMSKQQTAVSHISAESEIISLDASLRMDGVPAPQFWKCVLETGICQFERHKRDRVMPSHSHSDFCVFESTGHVPPNIPNRPNSTRLYIFEDNAAVIQMMNKA